MSTDPQSTREPASGPRSGPSFLPTNIIRTNDLNGSEVEGTFGGHNPQESAVTTPRPNTAPNTQPRPMHGSEDATTPTTVTFRPVSDALANQRPLPQAPFDVAATIPETVAGLTAMNRDNSTRSNNSVGSEDVDMDKSDAASSNGNSPRPHKKKKSQKFYCTDYPPCNLNFTRTEHLQRHIRKHTGERPYECFCGRYFSRRDNLRQHAQTVHQKEEIPPGSLAATSTRFPRQPRTDRSKPPGRQRAATVSEQVPSYRGHHRNSYSTSSIMSNMSHVSGYSQAHNLRRPLALQMPSPLTRRPSSPGGYSTPTSATFSTGQNSPRWPTLGFQSSPGPGVGVPIPAGRIYDGHHTPGRRLSTPSAANPFSPSGPASNPFGTSSTYSAAAPYSPSLISSPTNSTFNNAGQSMAAHHSDMDNRRRTWHQGTNAATLASFTTRLHSVMNANHYADGPIPEPAAILRSNAPPQEHARLPGISSLLPGRGESPPPLRSREQMMIDRPHSYHQPSLSMAERPRENPVDRPASYYQPISDMANRGPSQRMIDRPPPYYQNNTPMSDDPRPSQLMNDRPNSYHQPNPIVPERRPSQIMTDRPSSYYQPRHSISESVPYSSSRPMTSRDRPLSSHLDRQFNQLEIQGPPHADAASWATETARAVHATAQQSQANQPRVTFEQPALGPRTGASSSYHHKHTASLPVNMHRSNRRDGWYNGPVVYQQTSDNRFQGTSPEGSTGSEGAAPITPQSATATDYNPAVVRSNGYHEEHSRTVHPQQPTVHHYHTLSNGNEHSYTHKPPTSTQTMYPQVPQSSTQHYRTEGLDALAAAATSGQISVHNNAF